MWLHRPARTRYCPLIDRELHSTVGELAQMVDRIRIAGIDAVGRAQLTGKGELVRCHIEHDERVGARGACS